MRTIPLLLCALLIPIQVHAGHAEDDMVRVIASLDLERTRSEAHARCVRDVPASIHWLREPSVEQYCVLRYGAPYKVSVFVGVRLSVELERAGKAAQSEVVDALVEAQEVSRDATVAR